MRSEKRRIATAMKKTLVTVALCAATAVIGASACGGDGRGGATNEEIKEIKIGMSLALTGIPFSIATENGAKAGAAAVEGTTLQVTGPPSINPPLQRKQFDELLATQPDGVAVFPVPADFWRQPLKTAVSRGIRVNTLHVPPPRGSDVNLYVGMQEKRAAENLAEVFAEELGADAEGEIVLGIDNPGEPVNENRIAGLKEKLTELLPNVKVLGPFTTAPEPTKNYGNWKNLVQANPNALAFIGVTDQSGSNLVKIKRETGGSYLIGSFDIPPATLKGIKEGVMLATIDQQPWLRGYIATRVLAESVQADKPLPEGWIDTGIIVVTKENVDEIIQREASPEETKKYYSSEIESIFGDGVDGISTRPLEEVRLEEVDR